MALIDCPKCGKKVSDLADKCIHCNADISTGLLENTDKSAPNPISDEFRLKSLDDIKQKNSALIDCPKCGKKYTDKATKCPHCNPSNSNNSNESNMAISPTVRAGFYLKCIVQDVKGYMLTLFAIGFVYGFYFGFNKIGLFQSLNSQSDYNQLNNDILIIANKIIITKLFISITTLFMFLMVLGNLWSAGQTLYKQEINNSKLVYSSYLVYFGIFFLFLIVFFLSQKTFVS
jgi:uncharacterized C2H2 Zn-finger protein